MFQHLIQFTYYFLFYVKKYELEMGKRLLNVDKIIILLLYSNLLENLSLLIHLETLFTFISLRIVCFI